MKNSPMEQKENPETDPHLNQNRIYNKSGIANQRGYPYRKKWIWISASHHTWKPIPGRSGTKQENTLKLLKKNTKKNYSNDRNRFLNKQEKP